MLLISYKSIEIFVNDIANKFVEKKIQLNGKKGGQFKISYEGEKKAKSFGEKGEEGGLKSGKYQARYLRFTCWDCVVNLLGLKCQLVALYEKCVVYRMDVANDAQTTIAGHFKYKQFARAWYTPHNTPRDVLL